MGSQVMELRRLGAALCWIPRNGEVGQPRLVCLPQTFRPPRQWPGVGRTAIFRQSFLGSEYFEQELLQAEVSGNEVFRSNGLVQSNGRVHAGCLAILGGTIK